MEERSPKNGSFHASLLARVERYLIRPCLERSMAKVLKIDQALYQVDDETKIYTYLRKDLGWKNLSEDENKRNKRHKTEQKSSPTIRIFDA